MTDPRNFSEIDNWIRPDGGSIITYDQLRKIRTEAHAAGVAQERARWEVQICPHCGGSMMDSVKICSKCVNVLDEKMFNIIAKQTAIKERERIRKAVEEEAATIKKMAWREVDFLAGELSAFRRVLTVCLDTKEADNAD